jgi:NAD(P)-dependent dehydrogenase (short-subunit alcohol dehydrogenase family)
LLTVTNSGTFSVADLKDKTALVTGAGRGIGRSIALGLASAGAKVALLARSGAELAEVAAQITANGGRALAIATDVADAAQVAAAIEAVRSEFGVVDVLVNNAAVIWPVEDSAKVDPSEWAAALDINLNAVVRMTFSLLPPMLAQNWGRIVNISSGVAAHPEAMVRANAYATSKAALEAHSLNLAAELAGTGVTVIAYRPGGVDTAMQTWIRDQDPAQIGSELHERFTANMVDGELISPDESAKSLLDRIAGPATGEIWDVTD